jgi:hypothetical protein
VPHAHPFSFFLICALRAGLLNVFCVAGNFSKIWCACGQNGIKYIKRRNE